MRVRAMILCLFTVIASTSAVGLVSTPASARTTAEAKFVQRINDARARHGLPRLRVRAGLTDYARGHSRAMSQQRTLFHTSNFSVICCWSSISENVGQGFGVRSVHRGLMQSPTHRANILDPTKKAVGVGVVRTGDRLWVTQVFRRPR
jgi:uncharacterized protein YkwD